MSPIVLNLLTPAILLLYSIKKFMELNSSRTLLTIFIISIIFPPFLSFIFQAALIEFLLKSKGNEIIFIAFAAAIEETLKAAVLIVAIFKFKINNLILLLLSAAIVGSNFSSIENFGIIFKDETMKDISLLERLLISNLIHILSQLIYVLIFYFSKFKNKIRITIGLLLAIAIHISYNISAYFLE